MTPTKSRCRITADALGETVDANRLFASEDDRRRAELAALMAGDPYVEGWRRHRETVERRKELDEFRASQKPGCCAVCGSPIQQPPNAGGKPRRLCGNPECQGEYERAARRASRKRVNARQEVSQ